MRTTVWVLTVPLAITLAVAIGGCGGVVAHDVEGEDAAATDASGVDAQAVFVPPMVDASTPVPYDAQPFDAHPPVDGSPPAHARIIFVHASPDLPAIRLCFGIGTQSNGSDLQVNALLPPLPATANSGEPYPGIMPGAGYPIPDLIDLSTVAVTPFAVFASSIGAGTAHCDALVGADGQGGTLVRNKDYVRLATTPPGTYTADSTEIVAVAGCTPAAVDPNATVARCGPDYDPATGNVSEAVAGLDVNINAATMGAQVLHLAPGLDGELGGFGVAQQLVTITTGAPAVFNLTPLGGVGYGALGSATAVQVTDISSVDTPNALFTVQTSNAMGAVVNQLVLAFSQISQLTVGTVAAPDGGPYFAPGENYVFVLLGDPSAAPYLDPNGQPNAAYDGHGLHVIAFPAHQVPSALP
jgi:hypothetical protein